MYVCMSVTGLRLSLCIVYIPLARTAQDAIARWRGDRGRGSEDRDDRASPDVWKKVNCSTKG